MTISIPLADMGILLVAISVAAMFITITKHQANAGLLLANAATTCMGLAVSNVLGFGRCFSIMGLVLSVVSVVLVTVRPQKLSLTGRH